MNRPELRPRDAIPLRVVAPRHQRPVLGPHLYDLPELAEANEALAAAVIERLEPLGVSRGGCTRSVAPVWSRLLLGQVGGYRYIKRLSDLVRPIGTPRHRAEGADGPFVRGALLVRKSDPAGGLSDLRGRTLSLQEGDQDSANLLRAEAALLAGGGGFFGNVKSEAHLDGPVRAVGEGRADAALIDGVGLAHLKRLRPQLIAPLRVLLWTARSPGPPFIAALSLEPEILAGLASAMQDAGRDPRLEPARRSLLIDGFSLLEPAQYRAVLHFEQIAETLGYPHLR